MVMTDPAQIEDLLKEDLCVISFSRSSGPGGQNVNKVNTKVTLKWHIETSKFPQQILNRIKKAHGNRISKDGFLVLTSEATRDQNQNRADCFNKLVVIIQEASSPPKPRKAVLD